MLSFKKRTISIQTAYSYKNASEISTEDVEKVLTNGEIVEDYSEGSITLHCYLIFGYTSTNRPIHVVVGVDKEDEMVWIITVYEPNLTEWEEGFKQRRENK